MRLELFSSVGDQNWPNLVSMQNPKLSALPTVLVCPLKDSMGMTPLRLRFRYGDREWVVACDLLRPIHRKVLRSVGHLDEKTSAAILSTFLRILPD